MDTESNFISDKHLGLSELQDKVAQLEDENRQLRSELQTNKEKYQKGLDINKAVGEIFNILISSESLDEIARTILDQAKKLTNSKHGYVSSICPETGDNISHTLTEMMEDLCNVSEKQVRFPRGDDGLFHSLWGYSLNTGEAFFTNKPNAHPASKGLPDGHIPIDRFLSVPVIFNKEIVGQIALANSDRDYTETDIYIIKRLSNYYALAINKYRIEEQLKNNEIRYRNIIAQADGVAYQRDWEKNRYSFIDEGIEGITGYKKEEITPEIFESLIIAEKFFGKRDIMLRTDMSKRIGGENATVYRADYLLQKRDGQRAWVTDYSIQNRNSNGELTSTVGMLQDITKRIEAEEDMFLLAQLLDLAPASITVHDFSGNFLYANKKTFEIHDYSKDEFMAKNLHELDVPESEKLINERVELIKKNGEASFRVEHYKKDGSTVPLDIYVKLVDWKNQKVMISIATDISDKLQAEKAIRESEERYRQIVETAKEGIWVMNGEFKTTFVNQAMADMLGYNINEMLGKVITDFIFEEDLEDHYKQMENRRQGKDGYYERRFCRKDGSACWTIVSAKSLVLENGKFAGSFGMFTDITKRKIAEELLHEKEREFRTLVENVPGAVYRCKIDNPWQILYMSDGIQEISGRPTNEFLNGMMKFGDIIHSEDILRINKIVNECVIEKIPYEIEYRIYRPDGSIKWVSDHGRAIYDDNGNPKYLDGVIIDIDAQKQAEEIRARLQQTSKMESIGRLAGGVAHDFNNLLTVIQGSVSLAKIGLSPNDPISNKLKMIGEASERAANLTRQLLAFSRKQLIELKTINLNGLIENFRKMLIRIIGEDIELITILQDKLGNINADAGQIEQVIVNLAVNSRDAMPNGGKLTIETSNITIDDDFCISHPTFNTGKYVLLTVSDTGCGMDEETKKNIFEPFFTTKKQGIGTGLGLATVYGIIKQHGGFIDCYSEVGHGTEFKIYFPIVEHEALDIKKEPESSETMTGNETLLLVEDENIVREMTTSFLKQIGYNVISAENGGMALLMVEQYENPIHLLITDVVMPNMNGRQLAERLAKIRPEMKVLYTSGYTDNVIVHHGVLNDNIDFIGKPYRLQSLAKKIRDVLDRK